VAGIVWLASYPKSGNTWVRIFLANYLMNSQTPVPINQVRRFAMSDAVGELYVKVAGRKFDVTDPAKALPMRDAVLRGIVANNADVNFVKSHCIRRNVYGIDLIPAKFTRSSIYILRNPLDMVLSYARHHGQTVEEAVHAIGHPDNATIGEGGEAVVTPMGSWSEHVNSWCARAPWPQLAVIRPLAYGEASPDGALGQTEPARPCRICSISAIPVSRPRSRAFWP